MNWAIFLVGILAGWIIEWVVDLIFWRKRQKKWVAAESEYRTRLAEVQTELEDEKAQTARVGPLEAGLVAAQADAEALHGDLARAQADRDALRGDLARAAADQEALRAQLEAAEAEADGLRVELAGVDTLRVQASAAETEAEALRHKLSGAESDRRILADHLGKLAGLAVAAPAAAGAALVAMSRGEKVDLNQLSQEAATGAGTTGDDLTLIEGIGPRIQELLYQNDIRTYAQLAGCDVERLRGILLAAGPSFRMADPASWPRQARLAAAHDWVRLQTLKQQLTAGVRRPAPEKAPAAPQSAGPLPPDDLTILEGIGPKIQELLYQNEILTFAELATCDVARLRAILLAGGPTFRMADPTSWPRQARLAAAHDWPRLQALNEQLAGGVRRPPRPSREDDLTIIEGIGPQICDHLQRHGIRTFAQLARTDVPRLQEILAEDGPAFKLAAPAVASWPQQARLAADGAWDEFHALKDTLKAGREGRGQPELEPGPADAGEPDLVHSASLRDDTPAAPLGDDTPAASLRDEFDSAPLRDEFDSASFRDDIHPGGDLPPEPAGLAQPDLLPEPDEAGQIGLEPGLEEA